MDRDYDAEQLGPKSRRAFVSKESFPSGFIVERESVIHYDDLPQGQVVTNIVEEAAEHWVIETASM